MRLAVLGVGLIGASAGLAARERLGAEVSGWDPSPDALGVALRRGALDRGCDGVVEAVAAADAVLCAAPVSRLTGLVGEALAAAGSDCVVSDVGSTKRGVVGAHDDPRFIGGHPLAGAETAGAHHARAELFDGAIWFICPRPEPAPAPAALARLRALITGLGARPVAIDPGTHDRVLAAVSHLPHVLANALVAQAAATLRAAGRPGPVAGPSLRDATRVAGAPSAIWTDIYLENADAITVELDALIARLHAVRAALAAGDAAALTAWNEGAGEERRALFEGRP